MRSKIAVFIALLGSASASVAQDIDMEQMTKWAAARFVKYHVEGIHLGKEPVTAKQVGYGDIKDRVVLDFTWDLTAGLVGSVTPQNFETTVSNLRDYEPKCLPPVLKGALEYWTVLGVKQGNAAVLELDVQTSYPDVEVAKVCTSRETIPGKRVTQPVELEVPSPVLFGMGAPKTKEVEYVKERQVIIVRKGNWTWTFAPTIAKK